MSPLGQYHSQFLHELCDGDIVKAFGHHVAGILRTENFADLDFTAPDTLLDPEVGHGEVPYSP